METGDPDDQPRPSRRARLRAQRERVRARVESTGRQLQETRQRSTTVDAAFRAVEHDSAIGGGVLGAAVGFRVFLFIVPFVFVFVAGFGVASGTSDEAAGDAADRLGIGGLIAHSLRDFGNISFGQRMLLLGVGLFTLAFAARGLVKTLTVVHVLVWGSVNRRKVNVNKGALVLVALVTVALAVSAAASWLRGESFALGLIATILYMVVPLTIWLGVAWLLPHAPDVPWRALLPGAVVMAVGVELLSVFTVYWIGSEVSRRAQTYGALGAALGMLLWAYLLGRLVIAATVTNASLWRRGVPSGSDAG